jgi:N-acetylglucosamine-6-phosphate deacetylase
MAPSLEVEGRLVLDDRVEGGRITIDDGWITVVAPASVTLDAPYVAPGFVDVHCHGWGGHDAMGDAAALDGMSRALLQRGVTSFLPTAVTATLETLHAFADRVRTWIPGAPANGARPLGFNLEGPFLSDERRGAHDPQYLRTPEDVEDEALAPLLDGLRVITIAPELPGAIALIDRLRARRVAVSLGHSAATLEQAQAGYAAGGTTTTHLFNAMTGVDHRSPGLAVAALLEDAAYVELIADGHHVHPAIWRLIERAKPIDRLLLISDAISLAGMGDGRASIGGLDVEIVGGRVTLAGTNTLAGSVIALDTAVRNVVDAGVALPAAVAAATRNPLAMLGVTDRGRIAVGQAADLVELDAGLEVSRVMRDGAWVESSEHPPSRHSW